MNTKVLIYALGTGVVLPLAQAQAQGAKQKPNVLFIAVDDLRPELNCFGASYMYTPNFDRLAQRGTVFQRAYCQQSISAATRNSLLTGLRPDGLGIYNLRTHFRQNVPNVVTLPQYFKNNGYRVEGVGKIYHVGHGNIDDKFSWDVKWNPDEVLGKLTPRNNGDTTALNTDYPRINQVLIPYHITDGQFEEMTDSRVVRVATERMKELKNEPFFLAVGIVKPHLPFVTLKKYWDLYDPKDIVVPARKEPDGMPEEALTPYRELRKYHGMPEEGQGEVSDEQAVNLIHGYRSCVSYVDELIGILLDALKENGLDDNTIIVLWGDHGWKLGEYGNWCKHSNMEFDVNAPLIISAPGFPNGQKSTSLVEFVDIYPTICQLAGLGQPSHLQGTSLVPIMENPSATVKQAAISQYPRGKADELMGYSMRSGDYRYTRWVRFNEPGKPTYAVELYDHSESGLAERNLASDPAYKNTVAELDKQLTAELAKYKNHRKADDRSRFRK